jgi:hypothetical protein
MRHRVGAIELAMEEALVGLDDELRRLPAIAIGNHPVLRDDGIAFDPLRAGHGRVRCARLQIAA